ncbi:MAG: hypothetical protein HC905_07230 [Bacteroidales bacterium]|nr:hypothetical protein [Bacteroidales bacterium]
MNSRDEIFTQAGDIIVTGGGGYNTTRGYANPYFKFYKKDGEIIRISIPQKPAHLLSDQDIRVLDDKTLTPELIQILVKWLQAIRNDEGILYPVNSANLVHIACMWNALNHDDEGLLRS